MSRIYETPVEAMFALTIELSEATGKLLLPVTDGFINNTRVMGKLIVVYGVEPKMDMVMEAVDGIEIVASAVIENDSIITLSDGTEPDRDLDLL